MKRDDLPAPDAAAGAADAQGRPSPDEAWRAVHEAACAPYRVAGRFAWHWARGKLGRDPVFRGLLERGDLPCDARVVDIGCGQGLLASLLAACAAAGRRGAWPAAWPAAPSARDYLGVELMAEEVMRGEQALQRLEPRPRFVCQDMRRAALPSCDVVVILDVLHYVDHADQEALLERVVQALRAGRGTGRGAGRLLLRVGDAASRRGFAVSQWVDRIVTMARGHRVAPTWGRPLAEWTALLRRLGFAQVQAVPMSAGTPFANVLLVAELPAPAPCSA
jgi:SAM-dependent methyltransferase